MNNLTGDKSMKDDVLESIKNKGIKMRPKWHFILRAVCAGTGGVILLLTLLYLASFIIFILHQTGVWFVPFFGFRGLYPFFASLPWILILFLIIFIIISEVLVKHYAFAYRLPLLYSALGVAFLAVVGGLIIARTPLHGKLLNYEEGNRLPFTGHMYQRFGRQRFGTIHKGQILDIAENGFVMINQQGETVTVVMPHGFRQGPGQNFLKGDWVVVLGNRAGNVIQALGIKKVDE